MVSARLPPVSRCTDRAMMKNSYSGASKCASETFHTAGFRDRALCRILDLIEPNSVPTGSPISLRAIDEGLADRQARDSWSARTIRSIASGK